MKCPFCGIEMLEIVQPALMAHMKPQVMYDHPNSECEHGTQLLITHGVKRYIGYTYSKEVWKQFYKEFNP